MISGKAKIAGVIGWPIDHSRSPRLHNYWLARHDIDAAYVPLTVPPDQLAAALHGLPALGFVGANVTIPHKEAVIPFLDAVDPAARQIGAVNTIVVQEGRLHGSNTDGFGFLENLKAGAPTWRAEAGPVVLIGAGGAAKAVAWALIDAGVPSLVIVNRTQARAEELAGALGATARVAPWEARAAAFGDAALVVNTSALCWRRRGRGAIRPSRGSACCCIKGGRAFAPGSGSIRRLMTIFAITSWRPVERAHDHTGPDGLHRDGQERGCANVSPSRRTCFRLRCDGA